MTNLANEVNRVLCSLGRDDLQVTHYFNSVELYDGFIISDGERHDLTTVKVDHSQIASGEATPRKIAGLVIDYAIMKLRAEKFAPSRKDRVTISRYILEDITETLKQAAADIAILIGRELEDDKKAAENGVDAHISLESFYRADLENVNRLINKITRL